MFNSWFYNFRAIALALTATSGRLGAIFGNMVFGYLIDLNCIIPIYLFGFLLIGKLFIYLNILNFNLSEIFLTLFLHVVLIFSLIFFSECLPLPSGTQEWKLYSSSLEILIRKIIIPVTERNGYLLLGDIA